MPDPTVCPEHPTMATTLWSEELGLQKGCLMCSWVPRDPMSVVPIECAIEALARRRCNTPEDGVTFDQHVMGILVELGALTGTAGLEP